MAKEKEKRTARILFVEQNKTRKEIASLVGVSERTIGSWVEKFGWKQERVARNASPSRRAENIKEIITTLSDERIRLNEEVKEAERKMDLESCERIRQQISRIDDAVAKWAKTLTTIAQENKTTLAQYLTVMEEIFNDMRLKDPSLFLKTIEFQEQHLQKITLELG